MRCSAQWFAVASLISFFAPSGALAQDGVGDQFRFDPSKPILTFRHHTDRPYMGKPTLGLDFFGTGKLVAYLPEHYLPSLLRHHGRSIERRGRFEISLDAAEVEPLFKIAETLLFVEPDAVNQQITRQQELHGTPRPRDGGAYSTFSIQFADYRSSNTNDWQGPVEKRVEWKDLKQEARAFSGIDALEELSRIQDTLISLTLQAAQEAEGLEEQK